MRRWLKSGSTASQNATVWDAIKAGTPVHVRMIFTGQNITLEDQDISLDSGLIANDIFNGDTDLVFGKTVCKQINVRILNSNRLDGLSWTGEFLLQMWVEISSVEYTCDIGYFTGEKPRNVTTARYIEFTAYDRMKRFDELADDFWTSLTYPKTIAQIYTALVSSVGLTGVMDDVPSSLSGRSFSSAPTELEGYMKRDVLGWIAEQCGSYAVITYEGKCSLKWFALEEAHYIMATEEFRVEAADLNLGLSWNQFDALDNSQQEAMTCNDIAGYSEAYAVDQIMVKQVDSDFVVNYPSAIGGNVYSIVDNPFVIVSSASDVTNYVKPLFDRLANFGGYLPCTIECIGDPAVEAGDIVIAQINSGAILSVPVFVKTMRWNGGITDIYETTGQIPRSTYGTNANKQTVMNSNSIKMFVHSQYYNRTSGIEINEDGVAISGDKYVKVETAGGLYKWLYDENGISLKAGDTDEFNFKFWIGESERGQVGQYSMNGLQFDEFNFSNQSRSYNWHELSIVCAYKFVENGSALRRFSTITFGAGLDYETGSPSFSMFPNTSGVWMIGNTDHTFTRVYAQYMCGYTLTSGYGRVQLVPSDHDMQTRFSVLTDANHMYCQKAGTSGKDLIFRGSFEGGSIGQTTDITNMNNLTTPGHYWMTFSSSVTNKPSTLAANSYCEVIVTKAPEGVSNDIHQMIIKENEIYVRLAWMGTSWGNWYKFAGTQV